VGNEVKIKVRSDETAVNFDKTQAGVAALRAQATKDAAAMAAASKQLEEARQRETDAATRAGTAEQKLGGILAENRRAVRDLGDAEADRTKNLQAAAQAASQVTAAEEILARKRGEGSRGATSGGIGVDPAMADQQSATVQAAIDRLAAARRRQADVAGQLRVAEERLQAAYASNAQAVAQATARVQASQSKELDAVGKLRVAEEQLRKAQADESATGAQLAAAEERVAKARRDVEGATAGVTDAENRLRQVRDEQPNVAAAEESRAKKLRDTESAAAAAAAAERRLQDARDDESKRSGPSFDKTKSFLDKSQLLSEAKSYGIEAGAVLAGALGAGISTVGAAGLFIGIAAAAQSSNTQIRDAYSSMWEQVKAGAYEASSVLADDFINSAQTLGNTFNTLKPQMAEAFRASQPVLNDLVDGVDRMARSAMPGLVTATQAAGQASNGLADMMDSAGKAVASFFTESSKGAAAGGDAFRAFGTIVERLGTFAGKILAELANNSGSVLQPLVGFVDAAAGAIENLAHVALPGLASGAGFAFSGLTLLVNLASSLLTVLGPLVPVIMSVASALKLIDMVSFGQVGKSWGSFKGAVSEGEGIFGKVAKGAGAFATTLGPVGIAAGVVAAGLGYLAQEDANAAGMAEAHAKRVDMLTDALRKSNGVINQNVRVSAAQALQNMAVNKAYQEGDTIKKNMMQGANELNISQELLTNAYLGQGNALGQLNHQLDTIMSPYKDYNDMVAHANPEEQKRWMLAELMKKTINEQQGEFAAAAKAQADFAAAAGMSTTTVSKLAGEFGTLADKEATAETKLSALMKIMDTLAGRNTDIEHVTEAWEKFIDDFNKKDMNFTDKAAGGKKYVQSLIDASGQIKLTTEDGRKLYDTVTEGEKDFDNTAIAMKNAGASTEDIRAKLQTMRDAFVKNAEAMGFTAQQAEALATKYGLVPSTVSTAVSSNLQPEIQRALELGGTIRALPDGSFEVTANTAQAQGTINKLIQTNDGKVIHIYVQTSGAQLNVSNGSFARLQAAGGPAAHAAEGGARTGPTTVNERGRQEGFTTPGGDTYLLPMGGQVIPNANIQSMADHAAFRAGHPAGGGVTQLELLVRSDGSDIGEFFAGLLKKYVRVAGGGNVQLALGRA
jgi:hypothetical protein